MHHTKIILAVLLPTALALPSSNHGHGHEHGHAHKSDSGASGAPFPSGTGGAPYGMSNGTVGLSGTGTGTSFGTNYITTTLQSTIYQTLPASDSGAAAESATAAGPIESATVAGGSCGAAVTVTYNPTVTVTVTGNGSPAESAIQSSAPAAAPTPAPVALAPVAPAPVASASVASSPAAVPETSQAPVPTQAATSAAVVASAKSAPVDTLQPAPTTAASSPAVAASATTAATTSNTATPVTGSSAGSKRGVLIPAGGVDQANLVSMVNASPKISWVANWYSSGPPGLNSNVEFVPQMYGLQSDTDGTWTKNAQKAKSEGDKYFLSFGEPETTNAKLYQDASTAVSFWMKEMQPYTDTVTVGAPGVLQNTQDFTWLSQFLDGCETAGCKIGFIAIHWFYVADAGNVQGFKDVINKATAAAKGKPIWLDNFQATGTNAEQQAFLGEVVPWLESNTAVQRYAYVSPDKSTGTGFLNSDGSVSSLGQYYANL